MSLCDAELVGKRFEEGKRQIDVRENFYKDRKVSKEEAIKILKVQSAKDATFNIVGEKSVETAIEAGIINKDSVCRVQDIPFMLVLI